LALRAALDSGRSEGVELSAERLTAVEEALETGAAKFNSDVVAFTRARGRYGGTHKPRSSVEVGLLLLGELKVISSLLAQKVDIDRQKVSTLLFPFVSLTLRFLCAG